MRQGQIPQHAEFLRACGESNPRCPMPERLIAPRLCHWTMPRRTKLWIKSLRVYPQGELRSLKSMSVQEASWGNWRRFPHLLRSLDHGLRWNNN
ncbi:hypothetical protein RND71_002441 [Anisodus tanguticus]|uniref:Uncharacterized protein n=1 Tax=Anisodus tanguticus TaxID=243964 RepID=A0AAE1T154_9SOLA|nr:hypothetical protein RND71_002441 [Anisodus tanguticus]